MPQPRSISNRNPIIRPILLAGLVAGTLDALAAIALYLARGGKTPTTIFKYIASGVFGSDAFSGGAAMIVWGIFFHYLIAFSFTLFFFWVYPKVPFLQKNKVVSGLLYGLCVWLVMNLIVVPLSQVPPPTFELSNAIINILILMGCIGLPIAFFAHHFYAKETRP